jgi:transcriptional regulator with XRE-family HTH domain
LVNPWLAVVAQIWSYLSSNDKGLVDIEVLCSLWYNSYHRRELYMKDKKSFGQLLRDRRMEVEMTLREFSRLSSYDASNISKIERNVIAPPPTITLRKWAEHLRYEQGTEELQNFLDTAAIDRNEIPENTSFEFRTILLPGLLRTSRSGRLTKEEYDRLVKLLNK